MSEQFDPWKFLEENSHDHDGYCLYCYRYQSNPHGLDCELAKHFNWPRERWDYDSPIGPLMPPEEWAKRGVLVYSTSSASITDTKVYERAARSSTVLSRK